MNPGDVTFLHPERGALVVLLAGALLLRRWRRPFVAFPRVSWLAAVSPAPSPLRRLPRVLLSAALVLTILGAMEPVQPYGETELRSRGLDIVLVLDLSSSMQELMGVGARGRVAPPPRLPGTLPRRAPTRLDTTKAALRTFIARRPDDRIGLIVFSDHAYVVSPLTADHAALEQYVDEVDENTLRGEGMTAIGDGITLAHALLARQGRRGGRDRVIVVFTDGEHNLGRDPLEALEEAVAAGVRVHLVGVDLEEDVRRRPAVEQLVAAVRRHGGRYFRADTAGALQAATVALDRLEPGLLTERVTVRNLPVYEWFGLPALWLLLLGTGIAAVPSCVEVA